VGDDRLEPPTSRSLRPHLRASLALYQLS